MLLNFMITFENMDNYVHKKHGNKKFDGCK